MESASTPHSSPAHSPDATVKIHQPKNSSSSKGISSTSHGVLQQMDLPVCDLTKMLHPRRHLGLLESVQESNVKGSFGSKAVSHICRHCKRLFSSGRALGGHMRAHNVQFTEPLEKEQLSGNKAHVQSDPESEHHSAWIHFKKNRGNKSDFIEDFSMRDGTDALSIHESSSSEANNDMDPGRDDTIYPLYALRCNPKRSRRITDEEFSFDSAARMEISIHATKRTSSSSPRRARTCSECGKEFLSWKALFGHMRCHPEREWRGIQPPEMAGTQDIVDSGLGLSACKRRSAIHGTITKDSMLEMEFDLESKEVEELQASCKIMHADGTEQKRNKSTCNDAQEVESDKRGESEKYNSRREQGLIEEGQQNRRKGKESDNDSDLESVQRGHSYTWSQHHFHGRMTGKRSKRSRHTPKPLHIETYEEPELDSVTSPIVMKEELDMTDCLIMLAYAGKSLEEAARTQRQSTEDAFSDSARNWMAEQRTQETETGFEEQETIWIGKSAKSVQRCGKGKKIDETSSPEDGMKRGQVNDARQKGTVDSLTKYECNTCKRIFNSHQALGGHRASHRRVKGCFAKTNVGEESYESVEEGNTNEESIMPEDDQPKGPHSLRDQHAEKIYSIQYGNVQQMITARKFKGHECSICHRVFASGQALGGHKRCHWTGEKTTETNVVSRNKQAPSTILGQKQILKGDYLDLNLPAPLDDDDTEVAYGLLGIPGYGKISNAKRAGKAMEVHKSAGNEGEHDTTLVDSGQTEEIHSGVPISVNLDRRLQKNAEFGESQAYGSSSQVQLNFSSQIVHCNICDSFFTSLEAFSNHQKSHASSVSSVAALTPISA